MASEADLLEVGRLRYAVTVEEMKLKMRFADHQRRVVVEPMDTDGHVLTQVTQLAT